MNSTYCTTSTPTSVSVCYPVIPSTGFLRRSVVSFSRGIPCSRACTSFLSPKLISARTVDRTAFFPRSASYKHSKMITILKNISTKTTRRRIAFYIDKICTSKIIWHVVTITATRTIRQTYDIKVHNVAYK